MNGKCLMCNRLLDTGGFNGLCSQCRNSGAIKRGGANMIGYNYVISFMQVNAKLVQVVGREKIKC